jgi:Lrp/AsnC family transcriptional regulator, leucine-responsive regulatory protein
LRGAIFAVRITAFHFIAACNDGVPSKPQMIMIDEIDWKILKELQINARISFAELGRRVGLTTPAVIERIRKLEDTQIITGYAAEIDTAKVGLPILAFVRMSISGVDYSRIIEVAENSTEILECHRGTGGDSFIMKVAVADVGHLQMLIDKLTPYGITTTSIVLSSPVKSRVIEKKEK